MAEALILACREDDDVHRLLADSGVPFHRVPGAPAAIAAAPPGSGVLLLADAYPDQPVALDPEDWRVAAGKRLRLYVEYPGSLPGLEVGAPRVAGRERAVVASEETGLPRLRILSVSGCRFLPVDIGPNAAHLVLARVAGFDTAVYGLPPAGVHPLLFSLPETGGLVATTKLSGFVRGRYAPPDAWEALWRWILAHVLGTPPPALRWTPSVRPTHARDVVLGGDAEEELRAIGGGASWFLRSGLLVHPSWEHEYQALTPESDRVHAAPPVGEAGDGSRGVLEGFASPIGSDGAQAVRWWRRADCTGEVAGALALAGAVLRDPVPTRIAANLGDWLYRDSILTQGDRADPDHPAYGLIGWNDVPRYSGDLDGYAVYYGDDNARTVLGMIRAAAALGTDRWDARTLQCLLANLRLSGRSGFGPGRVDQPELERRGWRTYFGADREHLAPHFQAHMWACFLWAHRHTGEPLFLTRARAAIDRTVAAYPGAWRWTNGLQQERARMLLPLAWLIRLEDTPAHRGRLRRIAGDLLALQDESGAIREEVGPPGGGLYGPPASNEAYGRTEAPLIQRNGDPLTDLLYTGSFALLGLREAAAATGESLYAEAEDRLARFLCRIQVRSEAHPELDGAWFRAFDFARWTYWGSDADGGWGAWAVETGWTQGEILGALALRRLGTSLWDLTAGSGIARSFAEQRARMLPDGIAGA